MPDQPADEASSTPDASAFPTPEDQRGWEAGLADFVDLNAPDGWLGLQARYENGRSTLTHNLQPWRRCLQVARAANAVSAIIEKRYICYDYRSEFAAFYAHVLAGIPSTTQRIHLFGEPVTQANYRSLSKSEASSYLGYIVCRPRDLEIVGRTVLAVPVGFPVLTSIYDEVTFFGQRLQVFGVPFMQQDERLGICANIVAWIVHYSAYRRHQASRRLVAEFLNRGTDFFRPKAAVGMQPWELQAFLDAVGFRTEFFDGDSLDEIPITEYPWVGAPTLPETLSAVYKAKLPAALQRRPPHDAAKYTNLRAALVEECCRNLNSGLPVIVNSVDHTVVVCGYELVTGERRAEFVIQDDQAGPYVRVLDCLFDRSDLRYAQSVSQEDGLRSLEELRSDLLAPTLEVSSVEWFQWLELLVPLPERVFLPLQRAETAALRLLQPNLDEADRDMKGGGDCPPELEELIAARGRKSLYFRTYMTSANLFKHRLAERGADSILLELYRALRLSESIAVVEFVDTTSTDLGRHVCLGEAIFDATSNPKNPWVHALRLGTSVSVVYSDGRRKLEGIERAGLRPDARPYQLHRLVESIQSSQENQRQRDDL